MCFGDLNLLIKSQSIIQSFLSSRSVSYDENQFTQFIQFTWLANSSNLYHIATTQEINQIHPVCSIHLIHRIHCSISWSQRRQTSQMGRMFLKVRILIRNHIEACMTLSSLSKAKTLKPLSRSSLCWAVGRNWLIFISSLSVWLRLGLIIIIFLREHFIKKKYGIIWEFFPRVGPPLL